MQAGISKMGCVHVNLPFLTRVSVLFPCSSEDVNHAASSSEPCHSRALPVVAAGGGVVTCLWGGCACVAWELGPGSCTCALWFMSGCQGEALCCSGELVWDTWWGLVAGSRPHSYLLNLTHHRVLCVPNVARWLSPPVCLF